MIILGNHVQDPEKAKYTLSREANTWRISSEELGEFVFDENLVEFRPDIAFIGHSNRDGYFLSWASETSESRSGMPMVLTRSGCFPDANAITHIAAIWLGQDGSAAIHINQPCFVASAGDETLIVQGKPTGSFAAFSENIPEAKLFVQRAEAKRAMLRKINELDALASLEAQLDLLTELVLSHIPDDDISGAVAGVSTTTIHSKEKLVSTIRRQKGHLRNLQKAYFEARGTDVDGDTSA